LDTVTAQAISLIEANYDLEAQYSDWLDNLVEVGATTFDQGCGFSLDEFEVLPCKDGAELKVYAFRSSALPPDYSHRFREAVGGLPPRLIVDVHPPGFAGTWTEVTREYPEESRTALEIMGYPDLLGLLATDPKGVGIRIVAPLPEARTMSPRERTRWKMLGAHIAAAYRLRRALEQAKAVEIVPNGHVARAEAILDTKSFRFVQAAGRGEEESARELLRRAARRADTARSVLKKEDPSKALETWQALVCGRWSLVDWFDTDGRRFILALPNPPSVWDPRGLNEQESQVVAFAALGESNKLIAYRLGLSQSRVSALLRAAMQKLCVKSRAQLTRRLMTMTRPFGEVDTSVG
jgi:DNA-binding CsgD family transcriptional regulator